MTQTERWKALNSPPRGLLRLGLRLPILLYRARLGWLLGERFLLLTHVGRKSGQKHRTVLEVVSHERAPDIWYVAAGWGAKSDWYRNLQQNRHVELTLGSRTATYVAETQQLDQAALVYAGYARRHPLAFRELAALFVGRQAHSVQDTCAAMARAVPLVALHPESASRGNSPRS